MEKYKAELEVEECEAVMTARDLLKAGQTITFEELRMCSREEKIAQRKREIRIRFPDHANWVSFKNRPVHPAVRTSFTFIPHPAF